MRQSIKRLLVLTAALVMTFAMSMNVFAAGAKPIMVSKVAITAPDTGKNVSKVSLYANGESEEVKKVSVEGNRQETPNQAVYAIKLTGKDGFVSALTVKSANRAVATAKISGNNKITVNAVGKGKTTITVKDSISGKSAKLTVTVYNLVEEITSSAPTQTDDFGKTVVTVGQSGKVNLLAAANADASNKGLTYSILPDSYKVLVDGEWIDSKNAKGKTIATAKVDSKGNVTGINTKLGEELARATVRIAAKDQKVDKKTAGVYTDVNILVKPAEFAGKDIIQISNLDLKKANAKLGTSNTYADQLLYTNETLQEHSMEIAADAYTYVSKDTYEKDLTKAVAYTSSNTKVATVDADGMVTAVGNGKATISAVPANGYTKPKASFTVNVKTLAETINAPTQVSVIVGKTAKANASLDKKLVSNTKLSYEVKDGKEFISVSKSGAIKGLAEGSGTVRVSATDGSNVYKDIAVNVVIPVNKIKLTTDQTTIYTNPSEGLFDTANITAEITAKKAEETPTIPQLIYTSSKENVARVDENGKVYAVAPGKTTITAAATDGSKKKATVSITVAALADEITVDGGYYNGNDLTLNVVKNVKTTIKANVNSNATNKGYTLDKDGDLPTGVTFKKNVITIDDTYTTGDIKLRFTAKDAGACNWALTIRPVDAEKCAADDTVSLDADAKFAMKKGENKTIAAQFTDQDITKRAVTWSSSNTGAVAVSKTGVLTAKKAGQKSTITATFVGENKTKITKTVEVYVTKSDADFVKELNNSITGELKAEDRGYLGANVTYSTKSQTFDVSITDPYKELAAMQNTGFAELADSIADSTYKRVLIFESGTTNMWSLVRTGDSEITISENGTQKAVVGNISDAVKEVRNLLVEKGYITLGNMNGKNFDVVVTCKEAVPTDFTLANDYITEFNIKFNMDTNTVDSMIDTRIAAEVAAINADTATLSAAGIKDVTYNAVTNAAYVNILDGAKTINDVDTAARAKITAALKNIYAEIQGATVVVDVDQYKDTKDYAIIPDKDLDAAITELLDEIKASAVKYGITDIGLMEGGKVSAYTTFKFEENSYDMQYTVNFVRSKEAIDAQIDARVIDAVTAINDANTGLGAAAYDTAANIMTIGVRDTGKSITDLANTGLISALQNVLAGVSPKNSDTTAVVAIEGKSTTLDNLNTVSKNDVVNAFTVGDGENADICLGDLLDNDAVITVTYPTITGNVTLTYKVVYTLNEAEIDDAADAKIKAAVNAFSTGDIVTGLSYNAHAFDVELMENGNDIISLADTGLYELLNSAVLNGDIKAKTVTFISEKAKVTLDVAAAGVPDKEALGKALEKVLASKKLDADLAGTITMKVTYGKDLATAKNAEFTYMINLTMKAIAEEPTTPAEEPTTTVEEPTTTVEEPTTTVEEPTTPVEEPTTPIEEPTTTVEEPTTTVEEPATTVEEPTATE